MPFIMTTNALNFREFSIHITDDLMQRFSSFMRSMSQRILHYHDNHQFLIILNKTNPLIAKIDKIMNCSKIYLNIIFNNCYVLGRIFNSFFTCYTDQPTHLNL